MTIKFMAICLSISQYMYIITSQSCDNDYRTTESVGGKSTGQCFQVIYARMKY